jgi:hypothetical protein
MKIVRENISESCELYVLEVQEHSITINNKPVLKFRYDFFTSIDEARKKKKTVSFNYKSNFNKITLKKVDASFFKWHAMSKHFITAYGVERPQYVLRGELNKINPSTGKNIDIEDRFDEEEGIKILNCVKNM